MPQQTPGRQPFVVFDNVCKYYQMGDTRIAASDHVSFTIEKGEFCVILGPSGPATPAPFCWMASASAALTKNG